MLGVVGEDGVKDPVEAEDGVDGHDEVVGPAGFEGGDVPEEAVAGVWLQEGEIHEDIPEGWKHGCCQYMWKRSG